MSAKKLKIKNSSSSNSIVSKVLVHDGYDEAHGGIAYSAVVVVQVLVDLATLFYVRGVQVSPLVSVCEVSKNCSRNSITGTQAHPPVSVVSDCICR